LSIGSPAILRLQGGFARFGNLPMLADKNLAMTAVECDGATTASLIGRRCQ